jgi:hypothetical protein
MTACTRYGRMLLSPHRRGSALLIAVLFLLIIDGVVLGTLHLAMLERRLATSIEVALRLRLAAEAAAAATLARWHAGIDSLLPGDPPLLLEGSPTPDGMATQTQVEALEGGPFLVRAVAREPGPRHGVAAAALLVLPPPLPLAAGAAAAALSAYELLPGSGIVRATDDCPLDSMPVALRLADLASLGRASAMTVSGPILQLDTARSLIRYLPRIIASPAADSLVLRVTGDVDSGESLDGVIVVSGSLKLEAGADVRGLLIVAGDLTIEDGAQVVGAVHVAGAATVHGAVMLDGCAVTAAVRNAGLEQPLPLRHRPVVPAF